ncbi:MAG: diguanylate cyclase [Coriobacteriia bacterium]|nr:diguanylate cyclase [Coriobacteriia bacterium]
MPGQRTAVVNGSGSETAGAGGARAVTHAVWWVLPALAVSFGVLRAAGPDAPGTFVASQIVFLVAAWLSLVGSLMAWRSAENSFERRPWATFALACCAIAAGETYFSLYQVFVDPRGPLGFSPSDVLYGIGAVAFAVGLVFVTSAPGVPRVVMARRVADTAGLAVVVFAAVYSLIHAAGRGLPSALVDDVLETAYVVVGIVIVTVVALHAVTSRNRRLDVWERALGVAMGVFGAAVMLSRLWYLFVRSEDSQVAVVTIGVAFLCSYYLVFVAGVYRSRLSATSATGGWSAAERVLAGPRWDAVATSTILLVAIPVLGVTAFRARIDTDHTAVNFAAMALVGIAMVTRTALDAVYTGGLRRRAGADPLTGLPDARILHTRLVEAITGFERYGDPVSVIVLDLNDFGRINTLYGRDEGDRLVREVARSISSASGPRVTVGRLGSDEFAAVIEGADRVQALLRADRMRWAVHGILTSAGLPLTASWGVASCPQDSVLPRGLLMKAYSAQHWAKTRGRNRLVSYDPHRMALLDHVARLVAAQEHAELSMLLAIVMGSEARHETTRFHSRNVAAMSVLVAERIGVTPGEVHDIEIAALLHDIGKTGVSDEVLMKQGPRSRTEEALFRDHVVIGERIVAATQLRRVAPAVRAHHERWDGSGYPDGLSATSIPRIARVIAVCDAFEGLTSGRPDRRSLSRGAALQELDQNMCAAYDPEVVEALITVEADLPTPGWDDEGSDAGWAE